MTETYPYIPEGRTIHYVPASDTFMIEAIRVRNELSNELQHPTGAVIVLNRKIIGFGANQTPLRNKKLAEFHKKYFCIRRFLKIPSGKKYWLCPGCASPKSHAETSAVKDAVRKYDSIKGADLYLYGHWWCCKSCWDAMIGAGIRNVYLVDYATTLFKR